MKKISNYLMAGTLVLSLTLSAGAFYKANAATNDIAQSAQPVDLTYAAKKALPAVVHIKYVQNAKTQTIDVQTNPFDDFFFGDPFGFFEILTRDKAAHASRRCRLLRRKQRAQV